MQTPTFDVNGITFTVIDFKRKLSGRLMLRALTALSALIKNDTARTVLTQGVKGDNLVDLLTGAPDVIGSDAFKDLVNVLCVPADPQDAAYLALTAEQRADLALDVPLFTAYEAIKSFFGSKTNAEGSSVTTSAATP